MLMNYSKIYSDLDYMSDLHGKNLAKSIRILLVENHPSNPIATINQLKQLGYEADYATNGKEALQQLSWPAYDLVFMDTEMPILDGYELTRLLRQREGKNAHTVVVGFGSDPIKGVPEKYPEEEREKCLNAGMDDYLTKPFTIEALVQVLHKWLPHKFAEKKSGLVNPLRLAEISGGDPDFEVELLESYLEQTEKHLADLKKALSQADAEWVQQLAHQIKGASANVGIEDMVYLSKVLQENAKGNHLKIAEYLIGQLNIILQNLKFYVANLKLQNHSQSVQDSNGLKIIYPAAYAFSTSDRLPGKTGYNLILEESIDKIIDSDRLEKLSLGDRQFIEKLVGTLISNAETYLEQASAALANSDLETVARCADQIKNSSFTVGVRFMPEIAATIQNYAQQNKPQEIPQLLQQLGEILTTVKHWLRNTFQ